MARIAELPLKSGATVTMHTRLTYGEGRSIEQQRRRLAKSKQADIARDFAGLRLFVTGWTLKDLDSGEELPFTAEGLERADISDMSEIVELMIDVEAGMFPNASSASAPATSDEGSRHPTRKPKTGASSAEQTEPQPESLD